jgi:Tol biopolymer transport system component
MSKGKRALVLAVVVVLAAVAAPAVPATLQAVAQSGDSGPWFRDMTPDGSVLLLSSEMGVTLWHRAGALMEPVGAPSTRAGGLSADGRYLAFTSSAPDLVPDDPNGTLEDVFFRDLATGATERIAPSQTTSESGLERVCVRDGARLVFFTSWASDLVLDDTNGNVDVFAYDRQTSAIERVDVGYLGQEVLSPSSYPPYEFGVSADGRYVIFVIDAMDLVPGGTNGLFQAFLRDRATQTTSLVSLNSLGERANGNVGNVAISGDGQTVAFTTGATNFQPGMSTVEQVCLRDLVTGNTECVSMTPDGHPGDGDSWQPTLSHDGRYVAFHTKASNLAVEDDDGEDVYVKDRGTGTLTWARRAITSGQVSYYDCQNRAISADGRFVVIEAYGARSLWRGILVWDRDGLYDVPPDYWAFPEVVGCFQAGIVGGYPDGAYQPTLPVDRAQMAVYISRGLAGGDANVPEGQAEPSFSDVPTTHWAYRHIEYCAQEGVVGGYDDGNYHPEYEVTRDQMAVYVARALVAPAGEAALAGYVPSDPRDFPDVASDFWAWRHIEYCVENGVVQGYDDGLYHPERIVTRDQMAVYVQRAFQLPM